MTDKISYKELVIRIDEKLSKLINEVEKLCLHVNEENEKLDKRIRSLEDYRLMLKTQWKTLLFVASGTAGITAFIIKLLEVLTYIKI